MSATWIGFENLGDLLAECPPISRYYCYVSVPTQTTATIEKYNIDYKTGFLNVQIHEPQLNTVKYYRVRLGTIEYISGNVDQEKRNRQITLATGVFALVTRYLTDRGYTWREGVITAPKDLVLFESAGRAIVYDKDTGDVSLGVERLQEAA